MFFCWYNEIVRVTPSTDRSHCSHDRANDRFYAACFGQLPRNLCSRGPRGLKFFMHSHPLMGGRQPKFQQKNLRIFFCLISPTYFAAYNSCSKGPTGLKFVMRSDPPHAGPTTTFLFTNSSKIDHFFNFFKKKSVPSRVPTSSPHNFCYNGPRGLKFVMRIHPLTRDRVAYFDLKIRRKLFILSTFSKMFVK